MIPNLRANARPRAAERSNPGRGGKQRSRAACEGRSRSVKLVSFSFAAMSCMLGGGESNLCHEKFGEPGSAVVSSSRRAALRSPGWPRRMEGRPGSSIARTQRRRRARSRPKNDVRKVTESLLRRSTALPCVAETRKCSSPLCPRPLPTIQRRQPAVRVQNPRLGNDRPPRPLTPAPSRPLLAPSKIASSFEEGWERAR
jgi:hypothetical protein